LPDLVFQILVNKKLSISQSLLLNLKRKMLKGKC